MGRQRVAIIGATGSIGTQTLQVLRDAPDRFELVAYAVGRESAAVQELAAAHPSAQRLVGLSGVELSDAILGAAPDLVVAAATGLVGIHATINALHAGAAVAIANKETIVAGGELVIGAARSAAARRGTSILERLRPVDSEHSALWQCLAGESVDRVERFWLTASGGPFRTWDASRIANARIQDALKHPTWKMGGKITIDSASLVNKGLEVIEAHELFGVAYDKIDVVVHPQSVVHSMVEFTDGAVIAQLSMPDMRLPIAYALDYPQRASIPFGGIDWSTLNRLDFELPDTETFRCLSLAYQAGRIGGTAPAWLSAANEVAVEAFLSGQVLWSQIPAIIEETLQHHDSANAHEVEDILEADRAARTAAEKVVAS